MKNLVSLLTLVGIFVFAACETSKAADGGAEPRASAALAQKTGKGSARKQTKAHTRNQATGAARTQAPDPKQTQAAKPDEKRGPRRIVGYPDQPEAAPGYGEGLGGGGGGGHHH